MGTVYLVPKEQYLKEIDLVNHLISVADGCKDHPAYRAKPPPRVECQRCDDIYRDRIKADLIIEQYYKPA